SAKGDNGIMCAGADHH
ncbi:unnamed protein product, partial [Allacma fusca]